MKNLLTIPFVMAATSLTYAMPSQPMGQAVVSHPAVVAIVSLLNSVNAHTCVLPISTDVRSYCLGALPEVTQPTIAGTGCGFKLKIICSNGASADISGQNQSYEIIDQNHQVSSQTEVGIIIRDVTLTPAGK